MKSQNKFRVISTFSGCGGSSLGYQLAGGKVLLAVEMDNNAVETYKLNFPETPIYHGDIHNLTIEKVLELTGLKPGELDILDGSPPCQGFSSAGKRKMCDPRNELYNEYVRLLRGLKPKVFIMENVSGLVKGKMKLIFKDILTELKQSGYNVKVRLMNAKYYNVPQSRQRLIFIGVRNDLGIEPSHPKPESKIITVKDALGIEGYQFRGGGFDNKVKSTNNPSYTLKKNSDYRIIYSDKRFDDKLLNSDKPSPTIAKLDRLFLNKAEKITIEQAKILASFPEWFKFKGSYSKAWARIGNSVPPNFMKSIADHVYNEILSKV